MLEVCVEGRVQGPEPVRGQARWGGQVCWCGDLEVAEVVCEQCGGSTFSRVWMCW